MRKLILIAHNLRSTHNVGSLLRTAEGLGVEKVYLTGYTPYPSVPNDKRLPHIVRKLDKQIAKTALGAEKSAKWQHCDGINELIDELNSQKFCIVGLEQAPDSIELPSYVPPDKIAIIVGREVEGIEPEVLKMCGQIVEIPMSGQKESFNVSVAAAMALYHCRFFQ